jgi:hypothetical protein
MAGHAWKKVELSAGQRRILEQIVRRGTNPQRLVQRARLILACAEEQYNQQAEVGWAWPVGWLGSGGVQWSGAQKRLHKQLAPVCPVPGDAGAGLGVLPTGCLRQACPARRAGHGCVRDSRSGV